MVPSRWFARSEPPLSEADTADPGAAQPLSKRATRIVRQVGAPRLIGSALILLIGILIARFSWQVPLISDAERALYDIRLILTTKAVEQDPRILLVTYTDDTLINTQVRSPLDR